MKPGPVTASLQLPKQACPVRSGAGRGQCACGFHRMGGVYAWLIMCAWKTGQGGPAQARRLAAVLLHLRAGRGQAGACIMRCGGRFLQCVLARHVHAARMAVAVGQHW
jgi:hypothetical protein